MVTLYFLSWFWIHPIHVSVTEVNYHEKTKSLQIIVRLFIDDIEAAIQASTGNPNLDILYPDGSKTTNQWVGDYINPRLRFKINGKPVTYTFLGTEQEGIMLLCYLEIEKVKRIHALMVINSILQDFYDDQTNIVHVTYKAPVQSTRLTIRHPKEEFTFSE